MKIAQVLTATALAAGAVTASAAPAQAHLADVQVVSNGSDCGVDYIEIAQLDQVTVCLHTEVPEWRLVLNGAPCNEWWDTGWTEYSVLNTVRVCIRW